ncbi:hypothetical protein [Streptomyces millisiae]|uniref:Uncharacterized protein n=1 Tax=Streptomyces millisiae TaxID=3075542 RepID=A0ABU2LMR3_9ACTN|nr:hypothetical protein [Streptomyces sp. DSM 44918]MDT0318522.1 hypothetical protein [Streptomyces sp. DSM 44918]
MDEDDLKAVAVELTVTETVNYTFPVTVEIPGAIAESPEDLAGYLEDHEDQWLDELPIDGSVGYLTITERSVDEAKLLPEPSESFTTATAPYGDEDGEADEKDCARHDELRSGDRGDALALTEELVAAARDDA